MTKFEDNWNPEVDNDFKVLEWKARIQAEIYEETKHMTDEEVREYFRLASERAALRRKARIRRQSVAVND
ncbi:MAG: hypothetical protein FWC43_02875 [Planctomycetaceae bacterium]|nr:hypothetical protein [Planctomycetaceae bacterium]